MNDTNTGGPAFPSLPIVKEFEGKRLTMTEGLTMRDYFPAKAMQGIISTNTSFLHNPEQLAAKAFEFANAMLRAREQ